MMRRTLLAFAAAALLLPAGTASAQGGDFEYQIVGGHPVTTDQFPWQAAVVRTDGGGNDFDRQFCGGSLVTARIVLTAAHCVFDSDIDTPAQDVAEGGDGTPRLDPEDVIVILGRTVLTSDAGVEHQVVDVAYHEPTDAAPFNPVTLENDVGYLVLGEPGSTQGQIKIAAATEGGLWQPGVFADITGWGTTSPGGSRSNTLLGASVPIVSDTSCTGSYGTAFRQASMICAGYQEGGVDSCQGDSGGPLQSPLAGGGYRLVGITSWGFSCAQPNAPGVYARVVATALRNAIVAKAEQLVPGSGAQMVGGGGGQPRGGGPTFPPPSESGGGGSTPQQPAPIPGNTTTTTSTTSTQTQRKKNPFAKCRKIPKKTEKQKKKRKKCMRKVKKRLRNARNAD